LGRNSSFFILPFSFLVAEAPRKEGKRKNEKGKMILLSSKLRIAVVNVSEESKVRKEKAARSTGTYLTRRLGSRQQFSI
jgi:hypothetical protein